MEVADPPARLGDNRLQRGDVPQVDHGLEHDVGRTLGDEHVAPEVGEPPDVPAALDERTEPGTESRLVERTDAGRADVRVRQPRDLGHADQLPVRERPAAAPCPPPSAERGRRRDADHDLAVDLEPEQRGPRRHAAHEALRAIDGVHDPAARPHARGAELLADDRVARSVGGEAVPHRGLDRAIGFGYGRLVRLRVHVQVTSPEAAHGERVGRVSDRQRERQIVVEVRTDGAQCIPVRRPAGPTTRPAVYGAGTSITVAEPMPPPAHMLATP